MACPRGRTAIFDFKDTEHDGGCKGLQKGVFGEVMDYPTDRGNRFLLVIQSDRLEERVELPHAKRRNSKDGV